MNATAMRSVSRFLGTERIIATGSGTAGLSLALETVGVRGQRVLIPALTCPNVAIAVYAAGGTPVVVDISAADYNLDVDSTAAALDSDVRAIIAVNSFGYPADIRGLRAVAETFGAVVIEDACQSYGGRAEDGVLGTRADIGVMSFGYSKPVALEGGGLVVTRDDDLHRDLIVRAARHSSRRLGSLKNRLAVELMKAGRNRALRMLSRHTGLLEYGFPAGAAQAFEDAWRRFLQELDENRQHLHEARRHIAELPQVEPFEYRGEGWLPWRLSFKLAAPVDDASTVTLLRRADVPTTRLYRPLTEVFDVEVGGSLRNTEWVKNRTFNLRYATQSRDVRRLTDRLRRAVEIDRAGSGSLRVKGSRGCEAMDAEDGR